MLMQSIFTKLASRQKFLNLNYNVFELHVFCSVEWEGDYE
jgi:hypothetical protein